MNIYLFSLAYEPKYINLLQEVLLKKQFEIAGIFIDKYTIISDDLLNEIEYELNDRNDLMGAVTIADISKFSKQETYFSIILYLVNKIKIYNNNNNE